MSKVFTPGEVCKVLVGQDLYLRRKGESEESCLVKIGLNAMRGHVCIKLKPLVEGFGSLNSQNIPLNAICTEPAATFQMGSSKDLSPIFKWLAVDPSTKTVDIMLNDSIETFTPQSR